MKQFIPLTFCLSVAAMPSIGQQFINKAKVEYEVKTNVKKTMGNSNWAEMIKDAISQFKTGYYLYSFADNKSLYKLDHWAPNEKIPQYLLQSDEENSWYSDYEKGTYNMKKSIFGNELIMDDSLRRIDWKITNESRMIAGFNCRKAVGKILDSVYVFAFYTDEITIPGGPCSVHGLPGLILGLTIPRMYTSYIATKVMVNGVNEAIIKPVVSKKSFTAKALTEKVSDLIKDWGNGDDEDTKRWKAQLFWNMLL
jgi:GLPGLI family protein